MNTPLGKLVTDNDAAQKIRSLLNCNIFRLLKTMPRKNYT
jgi:hypothetical protein